MTEQTVHTLENLRDNFYLKGENSDGIITIMNDADDLFGWIKRGKTYITQTACDNEEAGDTEKNADLDASFRQLLDLERKLTNQKETMQEIKRRIDQNESIKDLLIPYENIQQELSDRFTSEESKYLTNRKYVEFRQTLWSVNHPDELMPNLVEDGDDDIVMGSTKISLKCPLTITWFENPVTSQICKHTFSKDAIHGLLRQNGGYIPCPVAGCNKRITAQALDDDEVMADRVRRAKARDEQTETNTQFFDVE